MKDKHTSGPWTYWKEEQKYWQDTEPFGYFIAPKFTLPTFAHVYNYPDNLEANAKLIAAAPDLKEVGYNLAEIVLQSDAYNVPEFRAEAHRMMAIIENIEKE